MAWQKKDLCGTAPLREIRTRGRIDEENALMPFWQNVYEQVNDGYFFRRVSYLRKASRVAMPM
jgi:hypothetical protein